MIFNDSLKNNIILWDDKVSKGKIQNATAFMNKFISSLPNGYDTILGDNGLKISGGQRKMVSIARELYKPVKILIFDEAMSAIDSSSEKEIQKYMDTIQGDRTLILISHRLSTIKNCDVIFVLKDGKVIETGSAKELYNNDGEFRRMIDLQTIH